MPWAAAVAGAAAIARATVEWATIESAIARAAVESAIAGARIAVEWFHLFPEYSAAIAWAALAAIAALDIAVAALISRP